MVSPSRSQRVPVELNAAQRAAVEHLHGPMLVVAGAGTGKTRVITERILYLLRTIPQLEGENILAITYTRKATAEMAARIRRAGDKRAEKVEVHTFHDFCYKLLRQHQQELRLLEDVDYWIFLRRRLDRLGLDIYKKLSDPGHFLKDFTEFFSRCQDELVSPDEYREHVVKLEKGLERERATLSVEELGRREAEVAQQQELARAYAAAEALLVEVGRTTFGGSLFYAVELLRNNAVVRERYQERFRYILVDEFQDANIAQIELLRLLAERHRNLMAVGDDDQAIYRFRGASYASFRKFADLYPDFRTVALTQNYRSTARILNVATTLIAQNGTARFDREKKLASQQPGGERVRLAEVDDPAGEAAFVRSEIERLQKKRGRWDVSAILYRFHRHRDALVGELTRARIPFVIRGLSILGHTLVRDLLAYLRLTGRPDDDISAARVLAIPAWGLEPEGLLGLIRQVGRKRDENHPHLLRAAEALHPRVLNEQTRLGALLELLARLGRRAEALTVTQLFDELVEHLGLQLLPSDPARAFLDTFTGFLRQWEEEKSESKKLAEFLEYMDYFEEANGKIDLPDEGDDRDAVQLMTVHTAKGLEFDSVFVLRLNRGEFPGRRRSSLFEFPPELMKEALPPGDFHIQEERRLCYVALTRGRQRLGLASLLGPRRAPSVFLEDVLRDPHAARDIEQLAPVVEPTRATAPDPPDEPGQGALFSDTAPATVYSRITRWAERPVPDGVEEPLALSHSQFETYRSCPLKYKFARIWKLPGRSTPAMVFGQIMHRSVREFFRAQQRQRVPEAELTHIYEQAWREARWPSSDTYQREAYYSGGREQLHTFYEQTQASPPAVLELEKDFQWRWEDLVLSGRIDQINRVNGQQVEIMEYKTGEPRKAKVLEKSHQLALYAQAAQHHLGLKPVRLTLYNFTAGEAISFAPDERALKQTMEKVREVAAGIRAGKFPATPGYPCRYCDYQRICPAYERLGLPEAEAEENGEGNGT